MPANVNRELQTQVGGVVHERVGLRVRSATKEGGSEGDGDPGGDDGALGRRATRGSDEVRASETRQRHV